MTYFILGPCNNLLYHRWHVVWSLFFFFLHYITCWCRKFGVNISDRLHHIPNSGGLLFQNLSIDIFSINITSQHFYYSFFPCGTFYIVQYFPSITVISHMVCKHLLDVIKSHNAFFLSRFSCPHYLVHLLCPAHP